MSPRKREHFEIIDYPSNTWTLSPEIPICKKPFYFTNLTLSLNIDKEVRIEKIDNEKIAIEYINPYGVENQFGKFLTKNMPVNYAIVIWNNGLNRATIKGEMFEEEDGSVIVNINPCEVFELLSERKDRIEQYHTVAVKA